MAAPPMMRFPGLLGEPAYLAKPNAAGLLARQPMAPPVPMAPPANFDPWPSKPGPAPAPPQSRWERGLSTFRGALADDGLQIAAAMMMGESPRESLALATQALGQSVSRKSRGNRTYELLEKEDPELAAWVRDGLIDTSDAFTVYANERKARSAAAAKGSETDAYGFPTSGAISQKIRAFEMQGMDPQTAIGLASGRYDVSINPLSGERVIIDTATQKIIPLQQPNYGAPAGGQQMAGGSVPQPGQQQPKTLWEMADKGTGAAATLQRGLTDTLGQLPGAVGQTFTFPETVEAQQNFDLFKRNLIQSLSLNPRFPMGEQQRIEGLLPAGAFTSPETLRTSLKALDQELSRIEMQAAAGLNDPRSTVEQRQADMGSLRAVREARQRLGVPGSTYAPANGQNGGRTGSGIQWSVE